MTDSFRLARLREIQEQSDRNAERMRGLRQEMNELEVAQGALHQQFIRATHFDPGQGVCPRCQIDDAVTSRTIVVTAAPTNPTVRCARCGWTETQEREGRSPSAAAAA